ncbi:MAG TPA: phage tail protein [Lamprocystis sp. (in: g-proteobacteria)]|nr:phage tail protein [Lamprocystis sp. (in: g-proteobacteria)]
MLEVMMALGSYRFSLSTAAYQSLTRQAAWRWPEQERLGAAPVRQYVGPGEQILDLEGVIYPHYRGLLSASNLLSQVPQVAGLVGTALSINSTLSRFGLGLGTGTGKWQLEGMRTDADTGRPLLLVDGRGRVWGHWCLLTLREAESSPLADGAALKIAFSATLGYYGEQATNPVGADQSLTGIARGILGI